MLNKYIADMYTYKKTVFIILFAIYSILSSAAELRKAEVVSDGDRGLALEWVYEVGGTVSTMTADEDGNVYMLGNIKYEFFVCKYTNHGELVWRKKFYNMAGFNTEDTIGFYHKKIK